MFLLHVWTAWNSTCVPWQSFLISRRVFSYSSLSSWGTWLYFHLKGDPAGQTFNQNSRGQPKSFWNQPFGIQGTQLHASTSNGTVIPVLTRPAIPRIIESIYSFASAADISLNRLSAVHVYGEFIEAMTQVCSLEWRILIHRVDTTLYFPWACAHEFWSFPEREILALDGILTHQVTVLCMLTLVYSGQSSKAWTLPCFSIHVSFLWSWA